MVRHRLVLPRAQPLLMASSLAEAAPHPQVLSERAHERTEGQGQRDLGDGHRVIRTGCRPP